MFIELVDSLRCLEPHEDTWLVASVWRMDGRHIVDGTLGCPVCRREYPVREGVAWFEPESGGTGSPARPDAARSTETADPAGPSAAAGSEPSSRLERAAALLGLVDGGGIVVLGGSWTECAGALVELGPAHVVVLNVTPSSESPQEVSALRVGDRLPFAAGVVRGVAVASGVATDELVASAVRALRARGRLVAPAGARVPDGVVELARDADDWVGERAVVGSPPIPLRSARR